MDNPQYLQLLLFLTFSIMTKGAFPKILVFFFFLVFSYLFKDIVDINVAEIFFFFLSTVDMKSGVISF